MANHAAPAPYRPPSVWCSVLPNTGKLSHKWAVSISMRCPSKLTFEEIKAKMNEERIKQGRKPKLTVCAVTSRYNRTAPILLAAEGTIFVLF